MDKEKQLKEIYYNPETGLKSADKLYKQLKGHYTLKEIREFVAKQAVNQLNTSNMKRRLYYPILAPNWSYQADVTEMNGKKILCVIEMTSKKAWARIIPRESAWETLKAFEAMNIPRVSQFITDDGNNFKSVFDQYLQGRDIERIVYTGQYKNAKMSIVERFNRTLKHYLQMYFTSSNTRQLTQGLLDQVVANYNGTYQDKLMMAPSQVKLKHMPYIRGLQYERIEEVNKLANKFKVGDRVRVKRFADYFAKEGEKWSAQVYTITGRSGYRYELNRDPDLRYMWYDLKKVSAVEEGKPAATRDTYEWEETVAKRNKKVRQQNKREAVDIQHMLPGKRSRKQKEFTDMVDHGED